MRVHPFYIVVVVPVIALILFFSGCAKKNDPATPPPGRFVVERHSLDDRSNSDTNIYVIKDTKTGKTYITTYTFKLDEEKQ
jgi:major membrane immunogen (membrane-anchored lipoprotein)